MCIARAAGATSFEDGASYVPSQERSVGYREKAWKISFKIFAEGVAVTAQGLKHSLLVPLLRKAAFKVVFAKALPVLRFIYIYSGASVT